MKLIKTYLQNIFTGIALALLIVVAIALIASCHPAFATTPQETCANKGGVWQHGHCLNRDMTDEEIEYAKQWVTLKQRETQEQTHER
ncbi:hypothetical protein [Lonepinella koalarum]|uniref:hypothetical protein n=1 Tax=Lonepinella koalarum TaxID=53417 RepID=UPI003F6E1539